MAAVYFTADDVELREVGSGNTVLDTGKLTITSNQIQVGYEAVEFNVACSQGPYRKVDSRTFVINKKDDFMTTYQLKMPRTAKDEELAELARVLAAMAEGKDPTAAASNTLEEASSKQAEAPKEEAAATNKAAEKPVTGVAATQALLANLGQPGAAADSSKAVAGPGASTTGTPEKSEASGTKEEETKPQGGFGGFMAGLGNMMNEARKKAEHDMGELQKKAAQDTAFVMEGIANMNKPRPDAAEGHK